jgi:hypothetical protein
MFMAFTLNSSGDKELTDRLIPAEWNGGNPWGPAANAAREKGLLPRIPMTAQMKQWDEWGRKTLRDGDILFRLGDARLAFGYFPFSRFIANASGSRYSHTGIVVFENGQPYVFDTTKDSVRRQPLHIWVLDNIGPMGVKRLKSDLQSHVPAILAKLKSYYETQVPFDYVLGLDDSAFYCVEMTEKTFRAVGLKLSDPVRLRKMENAAQHVTAIAWLKISSGVVMKTPISLDQPVFFPGNERHGIWSSPLLETVYDPFATRNTATKVSQDESQKTTGSSGS